MPTFSIIIPYYNSERFLRECIDSCLNQTVSDLEVIAVNDGSTDGSFDIALAASADPRIRLINQDNHGLGSARNAGLNAARGRYVNFLDADDLLEPGKLERQGEILDDNPQTSLVLCDGYVIDAEGAIISDHLVEGRRFLGYPRLFPLLLSGGQFPPLVPLIRTSVARTVGRFDPRREAGGWADTGFWLRLALTSGSYYFLEDRLCRYRRHGSNMSAGHAAMEHAARLIFTDLLATEPESCADALLTVHKRIEDLEAAASALRQCITASESARADLATDLALEKQKRADAQVRSSAEILDGKLRFLAGQSRSAIRPLVIWGAGSGGRRLHKLIAGYGGKIQAHVDSNPKLEAMTVAGVKIQAPAALLNTAGTMPFFVVASTYSDEICAELNARGLTKDLDFLPVDFSAVSLLESASSSTAPNPE